MTTGGCLSLGTDTERGIIVAFDEGERFLIWVACAKYYSLLKKDSPTKIYLFWRHFEYMNNAYIITWSPRVWPNPRAVFFFGVMRTQHLKFARDVHLTFEWDGRVWCTDGIVTQCNSEFVEVEESFVCLFLW